MAVLPILLETLIQIFFPLGDKYSSVTFSLCLPALPACPPQPFAGERATGGCWLGIKGHFGYLCILDYY